MLLHLSTGSESLYVSWRGNQECGRVILSHDEFTISYTELNIFSLPFVSILRMTRKINLTQRLFIYFRRISRYRLSEIEMWIETYTHPIFCLIQNNASWFFPPFLISFLLRSKRTPVDVYEIPISSLEIACTYQSIDNSFQETCEGQRTLCAFFLMNSKRLYLYSNKNHLASLPIQMTLIPTQSVSWRSILFAICLLIFFTEMRNLFLRIWQKWFVN